MSKLEILKIIEVQKDTIELQEETVIIMSMMSKV